MSTKDVTPEDSGGANDLRARFVRSALEILSEPETPLDLRKVAERAGKSRTAPYLVFGKEREGGGLAALRLAVAAEGTRMLCSRLRRARVRAHDALTAFQGMAEAFLTFASEHPRLYRLMFGPEIGAAARGPHAAKETTAEVSHLVQARLELEALSRGVITGCQEAGLLPPGDTLRTSWITWATLHGLVLLRMDGQMDLAGVEGGMGSLVGLASEAVLGTPTDTIQGVALTLLGAQVSKDTASPGMAEEWKRLTEAPRHSKSVASERSPRLEAGVASRVIGDARALRRAARSGRVFRGARILWIDDHPEWIDWERRTLEELGAHVETCRDTESALAILRDRSFHLILSDIARGDQEDAGVADLPRVREAAGGTPVLFYVGITSEKLGVPSGAWGVTNDPEELLHLAMDILERARG